MPIVYQGGPIFLVHKLYTVIRDKKETKGVHFVENVRVNKILYHREKTTEKLSLQDLTIEQ